MDKPYDSNEFEKQQAMAKAKEQLNTEVQLYTAPDGKSYAVTPAHIVSTQIRQTIAAFVKTLDPAAYAEYKKMKYASGQSPSLAERRAAYEFLFKKFLEATYTIPGF